MSDLAPIPPASDDGFTQDFLDERWRMATGMTTHVMATLRELVPTMRATMPETAYHHLRDALSSIEAANSSLQSAGRHLLGEVAYKGYVAHQIDKTIGIEGKK